MVKHLHEVDSIFKARTIVEDTEYAKKRDAIFDDIEYYDMLMSGLDITIARNPHIGQHVEKSIWACPISDGKDGEYIIYYTFDDDKVYLTDIIAARPDPFDEEIPF